MHEYEMANKGTEFFLRKTEYTVVKQEVPFLSRCIDLVLINTKGELISIEFKINDWRHAIEQALNHKLGTDKAYICLPKRGVTDALRNAVTEAGVGLMLYNEEELEPFYEVIPPPSNHSGIPVFKKMLRSNLERL